MNVESMYDRFDSIPQMTTRDNPTWRRLIVMNAILHLGGRTQDSKEYVAVMSPDSEFRGDVLKCREVYDTCIPPNRVLISSKDALVDRRQEIGAAVMVHTADNTICISTTSVYNPW